MSNLNDVTKANSVDEVNLINEVVEDDRETVISNLATQEAKDYIKSSLNYTKLTNKLIRVTERELNALTTTFIKFKVIEAKEYNMMYESLCHSFNKVGVYGKGSKFSSPSLDILRSKTNVFLSSLKDEKDVIFTNNTYFFKCGESVVKCEGLIIKQAKVGDMFTDTGRANDKLTLEALNEVKAMTEIPLNTGEQATTK